MIRTSAYWLISSRAIRSLRARIDTINTRLERLSPRTSQYDYWMEKKGELEERERVIRALNAEYWEVRKDQNRDMRRNMTGDKVKKVRRPTIYEFDLERTYMRMKHYRARLQATGISPREIRSLRMGLAQAHRRLREHGYPTAISE